MPSSRLFICALLVVASTAITSCKTQKVVCPEGFEVDGTDCVCPAGTHLDSTTGEFACVPDKAGGKDASGGSNDDVKGKDASVADAGAEQDLASPDDDATTDEDLAALEDVDQPPADGATVDAHTDLGLGKDGGTKPQNPVGQPCGIDEDCNDPSLTCFNWPSGYCTTTLCDQPGAFCIGASQCWTVATDLTLCALGCEANADCRTNEGYACKRLNAANGGMDAALCLPTGTSPAGGTCKGPMDCASTATCLTDIKGGYCAQLFCSSTNPCPSGSACVMRNGTTVCLKTCAIDKDCAVPSKDPRACVAKKDLTKKDVNVCLDSKIAAPIGSACTNDLDCESGSCAIYAQGTCAAGGSPCMESSDCGVNGPCNKGADDTKGVCASPCGISKSCAAKSACVPGSASSAAGVCRPNCMGPGDDASCGGVPGLGCVYGDPIGTSGGAYVCAPQVSGAAGAKCMTSADCASSSCMSNNQKSDGFCLAKCGGTNPPCPFGTTCLSGGVSLCQKRCATEYDCPQGFICKDPGGASGKICVPQ